MSKVELDRSFAEDLVDTKIRVIKKFIVEILKKWNYDKIEIFVNDAKSGKLEESEDDAITIKHLKQQMDQLYGIKASWN